MSLIKGTTPIGAVVMGENEQVLWGTIQGTLTNQLDLKNALDGKVDKISGKGLSTNDYTSAEKLKLSSLPTNPITQETDPTVPLYVKNITVANITSWNNKQEQLTAGENIIINGNVISAVGGEDNLIENVKLNGTSLPITNKSVNVTVPTATSALINDSGFITKTVSNLDNYTLTSDLAGVALSGDYEDLSNIPSFATVAISGNYSDLNEKPNLATVAISGSYTDLTNRPTFATVATSGNYNDLNNKPTIPDISNLMVNTNPTYTGTLSGANGTFSGKVTVNASATPTTSQVRNVTCSTSEPTSADGQNGDLWIVYEE